jgi:hypothetical protein
MPIQILFNNKMEQLEHMIYIRHRAIYPSCIHAIYSIKMSTLCQWEVKLASRRKNYGNAHVKILYFLETDYIFLKWNNISCIFVYTTPRWALHILYLCILSRCCKNLEKALYVFFEVDLCSFASELYSVHFKYVIDKSIGLDNRLCLCKSSPTTRWNN